MNIHYKDPALKDILEGIILPLTQKTFFQFANQTLKRTSKELDHYPALINHLTLLIVPQDHKDQGLCLKHTIVIKVQNSPEEIETTLIHEVIHILEPTWSEKDVENKAQELFKLHNPTSITI